MILENCYFQKKMDTIEDHHNKHTMRIRVAHGLLPVKNCLSAAF